MRSLRVAPFWPGPDGDSGVRQPVVGRVRWRRRNVPPAGSRIGEARRQGRQPGRRAAAPAAKPSAESPAVLPVKAPEEPAAKPAGRGHSKPAAEAAAAPATPHALRFQFRFQPWKDVLDWFARQADLSLVMDAPPPGTFNYTDNHVYTPSEAIDLLNSVLLTKGFTLIRRGGMLMLVNLEDGIPPNLVPTVPLDSLDSRGEYELVRVPFNLEKLKPEEAEAEIKKLLGPQGSVVSLPKSRQVYITETGGRLRAIRTMLERIEGPSGVATAGLRTFDLKFARTEDVLPILRQLLDIPEDKNAAADGSIRVAVEAGAGRLILSGQPEKVARAADIIRGLDVPAPGAEGASRLAGTPQLEVYPAGSIDAQAALAVLQTLLAGQPDVRLSIDSKTNSLIAMARPAQHATIRATLSQLQGEGQRVEVIRLVRLDPQTVATAINKLFGGGDTPKPGAPQVEADAASRQLIVRGSESQIAQIRGLLEQMGEPLRPRTGPTQGGRVRTLPFGGSAARSALERIEEIWPTLRSNKIRVIGPSAVGEGEPGGKEPEGIPPELLNRLRDLRRSGEPPQDRAPPAGKPGSPEAPPPAEKPRAPLPAKATPTGERSAGLADGARLIFVADTSAAAPAKPAAPPPIIVIPGPSGLIIASEDTEALDEFEHLLDTMVNNSTSVRGVTVYYLKHAKAAAVADALVQIMGAASGSGGAASSAQASPDPFGGMGGPFGASAGRSALSAETWAAPSAETRAAADAAAAAKTPAAPPTPPPPPQPPWPSPRRARVAAWPPDRSRLLPTSGSTPCWCRPTAPTWTASRNS